MTPATGPSVMAGVLMVPSLITNKLAMVVSATLPEWFNKIASFKLFSLAQSAAIMYGK